MRGRFLTTGAVAAAVALCAGACDSGATQTRWTVRFPNETIRGVTEVLYSQIRVGDCRGTPIYSVETRPADPGAMPAGPPLLSAGSYGLFVEARDTSCNTIARGCLVVSFPKEGEVEVRLDPVSPSVLACASAACTMGSCRDLMIDGGVDAGDAGDYDAGSDAGPPTCTTEGEPCPTGGVCHAGSCCTGCWTGTSCATGVEPTTCGPPGGACTTCGAGHACRDGACLDEGDGWQLSLSPVTAFVRAPDGRIFGTGDNGAMQLGPRGSPDPTRFAAFNGTADAFVQVAAAQSATCALTTEGQILCWGRLASAGTMPPTAVSIDAFNQIAAGNGHFCAIRSDARLYCWGDNPSGQLGIGGSSPAPRPAAVAGGGTWVRVAGGNAHTCGIRTDGTLWCWGNDEKGQVGNGESAATGFDVPQRVGTEEDWIEVACGVQHTCGVRLDGSLWCWGNPTFYRMGIGMVATDAPPIHAPVRVGMDVGWSRVGLGNYHGCALRGGQLYCWGVNARGAVGCGMTCMDPTTPLALMGTSWAALGTGWTSTCGVLAGALYCWGENTNGQLGLGDTTWRYEPTPVTLP